MNLFRAPLLVVAALLALAPAPGCATSRLDQLHRKADRVGASLKKEQTRVLTLNTADRADRLDHLNGLRAALSAANVGLGAAPHVVDADKLDVAYDVIEEVYDTIEWNIPLGPSDAKRALPAQFSNGVLNLNAIGARAPAPSPPRP